MNSYGDINSLLREVDAKIAELEANGESVADEEEVDREYENEEEGNREDEQRPVDQVDKDLDEVDET
jgi:vacuolar-type H+-ATPase subunit I/STV1